MTVITGLDMAIANVSTAHSYRMEISDELKEYIASGGASGVGNKCGIDEWRGAAMAYGYLPPAAAKPGTVGFALSASLDGTYGFSGTAYCEAWEIVWDIENGEYIAYTIQFSRNGAITAGEVSQTDSTQPDPPCSQSLPLKLNGSTVSDVSYMRLRLTCPGRWYVSSSTSGGRLRKRGAMKAEFEYHCYYQDPSGWPSRGTNYTVQPYCTDSLYYDINWMKVRSISPYVNTEARRPVNARVIMDLNSSNGSS